MRSLNFFINSSQNPLYEICVTYLFEVGHNIYLFESLSNSWEQSFLSKINIVNDLNSINIDYVFGFDEKKRSLDFDIYDNVMSAFIRENGVHCKIYDISFDEQSRILDFFKVLFADVVIILQRDPIINDNHFVPKYCLQNIESFYIKNQELKNLFLDYEEIFYLPHISNNSLKSIDISYHEESCEIFVQFLLYLFNGRKDSSYVYDILFDGIKVKKIFRPDLYINDKIYKIKYEPLYQYNFELSEILITNQLNNENYKIKFLIFDGLLKIEYYSGYLFFEDIECLYKIFVLKIQDYINQKIDFYNLSLLPYNQIPFITKDENYLNILDLFHEVSLKYSNKIALMFGQTKYSYQQLDELSDNIAYYISNVLKIKKQSIIGLYLPRTDFVVMVIIGILKAGCIFMPIDTSIPRERFNYIIKNSKPTLVIDENFPDIKRFYGKSLLINKNPINPKDIAYILYTSGTTGNPKGVLVSHASLFNSVSFQVQNYLIELDSLIFGLFINYVFDASISAIFLPLLSGNSLVVSPDVKEFNINYILNSYEINAIILPVQMLSLIDTSNKFSIVITGGEKLNDNIIKNILNCTKLLIYEYGLTETTIVSSYKIITSNNDNTIGKPIHNTYFHVLDDKLNDLPNGVIGNLYISGASLANGYIDQKENFRFVNNMYNTGDLVIRLNNGEYLYCGRNDSQIKINGYRIEISEIEHVILQNLHVKNCSLLIENNQIIAFIQLFKEQINANQIVDNWNKIADIDYNAMDLIHYPLNTQGWISSYSNLPLPMEEMVEWIDCVVNRILKLKPKNIIEIGCGSGLVLFKLLNKCKNYYAVDFSDNVISFLSKVKNQYQFDKLSLYHAKADSVPYNYIGNFDFCIINSVAQYFPNIQYFEKVLVDALNKISKNGTIFIGDLRDYRLIDEFYSKVLKCKNQTITKQKLAELFLKEKELLISPQYFNQLKNHNKNISYVEILPKYGNFLNEMNEFRYDVILHVNSNKQFIIKRNKDFQKFNRIHYKIKDIFDIAKKEQKHAKIYLDCENKDMFNVAFVEDDSINFYIDYNYPIEEKLFNNPSNNSTLHSNFFEDNMVSFLKSKLPNYMIPHNFIYLDEIPLTRNGKIDLESLKKHLILDNKSKILKPLTKIETQMTRIWSECLGLHYNDVGLNSNFFDLGGDSITAIRIVNAINKKLNLDITFSDIIDKATISECLKNINNLNTIQMVNYEI